jgi:hypothetical protein
VLVSWNIFEFEVEEEDDGNPLVDSSIGLDVRVAEHTFDIAGIDFNDKLVDANEVEAGSTEGAKETIELEFSLGIMGLALIPQDGAKVQRAAMTIGAVLSEDPSHAADR